MLSGDVVRSIGRYEGIREVGLFHGMDNQFHGTKSKSTAEEVMSRNNLQVKMDPSEEYKIELTPCYG